MAEEKTIEKKTTPKKETKPKTVVKKQPVKKTQATKKPETKKTETPKKTTNVKKETKPKTTEEKKTPSAKKEEKPAKTKTDEKEDKKPEIKVKKKPELKPEIKDKLEKRKEIKKRTPAFLREEWYRYKRIPKNWRRPDGITSKMRRNFKYRPSKVRVGFRGPKDVRGFHASGFEEVAVYNLKDLENINPKTQAARIGGTVGTRKRTDIGKKAEELNIRVLNL